MSVPGVRRWVITTVCGKHGERCLDRTIDLCCERRNPFLQLVYVLILGGSYYAYTGAVFALLPTANAPLWHMCDARLRPLSLSPQPWVKPCIMRLRS